MLEHWCRPVLCSNTFCSAVTHSTLWTCLSVKTGRWISMDHISVASSPHVSTHIAVGIIAHTTNSRLLMFDIDHFSANSASTVM